MTRQRRALSKRRASFKIPFLCSCSASWELFSFERERESRFVWGGFCDSLRKSKDETQSQVQILRRIAVGWCLEDDGKQREPKNFSFWGLALSISLLLFSFDFPVKLLIPPSAVLTASPRLFRAFKALPLLL